MINNFRYIIQRQMYTTLGSSYTNMPYTYAGGSSYGPNPSDLYRKTIEDYGDYYNPMTRQLEDRDMLRGGVNTQFLSRLLPFAGTAFSLIGPNKLIKPKALQNITSKISEKTNEDLGKFYGLQTEIKDKLTENEKEISSIHKRIESIDEYLEKNAPYYGEKAEATKSIEDFYGEEKPAPEEPKKKVTKLYDWNKLDRSSPNYIDPKEENEEGKIY